MYDNIVGQTTTGTRSRSGTLMIGLATMRTSSFRWLVELIKSRGIDFVMQQSSKMCRALQNVWPTSMMLHHTLLKRQIGAFLQTDLIKQILNILKTGCTISSPIIQIFSEWARPGQCSQHQVLSKYSMRKYFRSQIKQKQKECSSCRMSIVQLFCTITQNPLQKSNPKLANKASSMLIQHVLP